MCGRFKFQDFVTFICNKDYKRSINIINIIDIIKSLKRLKEKQTFTFLRKRPQDPPVAACFFVHFSNSSE